MLYISVNHLKNSMKILINPEHFSVVDEVTDEEMEFDNSSFSESEYLCINDDVLFSTLAGNISEQEDAKQIYFKMFEALCTDDKFIDFLRDLSE